MWALIKMVGIIVIAFLVVFTISDCFTRTEPGEIVDLRLSLGMKNANPAVAALKHNIARTDGSPCLRHYRETIPASSFRMPTACRTADSPSSGLMTVAEQLIQNQLVDQGVSADYSTEGTVWHKRTEQSGV